MHLSKIQFENCFRRQKNKTMIMYYLLRGWCGEPLTLAPSVFIVENNHVRS